MAIPPNVSPADFTAALSAWREAVGAEWVFTSDEDIALYRDAYSPYWGEPEERVASPAVAPATLEQVQAVVRFVREGALSMAPFRKTEITDAELAALAAYVARGFRSP